MDVKDLVDRLIDEGCDIYAVGDDAYVIGEPMDAVSANVIAAVLEEFGDRQKRKNDIVRYLRHIGRFIDVRPQ